MKQEIELCDTCETGKVIAHYEGHAFCSCQCFLVFQARKWPALVNEIKSKEEYVKSKLFDYTSELSEFEKSAITKAYSYPKGLLNKKKEAK